MTVTWYLVENYGGRIWHACRMTAFPIVICGYGAKGQNISNASVLVHSAKAPDGVYKVCQKCMMISGQRHPHDHKKT